MTKEQKAAYDREYRKRNAGRIKELKAAYFQRTYDPIKAAVKRKTRAPQHLEYCRQPRYKVWKKEYDRKRRLKKFGQFAEAYEVLRLLLKEIKQQMPDRFERYAQSGRHQWNPINQQRYRRKNNVISVS